MIQEILFSTPRLRQARAGSGRLPVESRRIQGKTGQPDMTNGTVSINARRRPTVIHSMLIASSLGCRKMPHAVSTIEQSDHNTWAGVKTINLVYFLFMYTPRYVHQQHGCFHLQQGGLNYTTAGTFRSVWLSSRSPTRRSWRRRMRRSHLRTGSKYTYVGITALPLK